VLILCLLKPRRSGSFDRDRLAGAQQVRAPAGVET
jgi:hypothetical protein